MTNRIITLETLIRSSFAQRDAELTRTDGQRNAKTDRLEQTAENAQRELASLVASSDPARAARLRAMLTARGV